MSCCKYSSGQLRDRVNLFRTEKEKGRAGGYKRELVAFTDNPVPVNAKIMGAGRRDSRGDYDKVLNRFTFVFRYREDITDDTIIEFFGERFRITGKWPHENKKFWFVVEAISEQE